VPQGEGQGRLVVGGGVDPEGLTLLGKEARMSNKWECQQLNSLTFLLEHGMWYIRPIIAFLPTF
jgi:hypothetical protein